MKRLCSCECPECGEEISFDIEVHLYEDRAYEYVPETYEQELECRACGTTVFVECSARVTGIDWRW